MKPPGLVVNAENSQSEKWSSDVGSNPNFTFKLMEKKMDLLMAENITKIIKTAKWGKSHQKIF